MNRTVVLILLDPQDTDTQIFSHRIESDPELAERVEIRFASSKNASEAIADAEVVVGGKSSAELLTHAGKVQWVSFWSAGLDGKLAPELLARNIRITNSSGVHGPNIAEHVLAFILMFSRRMHLLLRKQMAGEWWRGVQMGELAGETLGIVGLGRIGEALTVRAKACEMRVIATKRNPDARYDAAVKPDALYAPEELPRLLAESDHVCIAVPYTPETHHLFDTAMLAHIKPTAYLYNIARGKIVDEAALIAALQEGKIAGAGLDVFETEPLTADSPLWQMENVLITPHVSGGTPHYFARTADLFAENLKRYLDKEPLENLYDPERGY